MTHHDIIDELEREIERHPVVRPIGSAGARVDIADLDDGPIGTGGLHARLTLAAQRITAGSTDDAASTLAHGMKDLDAARALVPPTRVDRFDRSSALDAVAQAWRLSPARHGRIGISFGPEGLAPVLVLEEGIASVAITRQAPGSVLALPDMQRQEPGAPPVDPRLVYPGGGPLAETLVPTAAAGPGHSETIDWYARLERKAQRTIEARRRGSVDPENVRAMSEGEWLPVELAGAQWPEPMRGSRIDPVHGTIMLVESEIDLPGPLPVSWRRWFNGATATTDRSLGRGHAHEFDEILQFDLDGIRYTPASGIDVCFPPLLRDGDEVRVTGLRLMRTSSTTYAIDGSDGITHEFVVGANPRYGRLAALRGDAGVVEFRYDAQGVLRDLYDAKGRHLYCEHGADGRVVGLVLVDGPEGHPFRLLAYGYDAQGRLTCTVDPSGAATTLRWDAAGRLAGMLCRDGHAISFDYDAQGRCTRASGDDAQPSLTLRYDDAARVTTLVTADFAEWRVAYDANGLATSVVDPHGATRRIERDRGGRLIAVRDAVA